MSTPSSRPRDFDCARKAGLRTIDSFDVLAATGAPRKLYVTWHMNETGNRLVAELVARALDLPRRP